LKRVVWVNQWFVRLKENRCCKFFFWIPVERSHEQNKRTKPRSYTLSFTTASTFGKCHL